MTQQTIAKGELLELTLDAWGRLGEAMARFQETDVFVFGGIPGERVTAEVMRVHRRHAEAQVVEVLESSPWRVKPPCSYYGQCTGCQWQHVDYQHQLEVKHDKVVDALKRVGGFDAVDVSKVVPSPKQYGYRNHARFTIGRQGDLGFVHRQSRQFVKIDRCMLMHDGINATLTELQDRCGETTQLSIRAGQVTQDTLVQPRLFNPDILVPTGQKTYQDSIEDRPFRVSSPSFFQVNVEQAAKVVQVIQQALDLKKTDLLVDAYMGVGAFAALLAPYVKKVIGIEESSAAVADAKENIKDIDNVELALGKTEAVLGLLEESPDAVVLDPPRAGCQAGCAGGTAAIAAAEDCLRFLRRRNLGAGPQDTMPGRLFVGAGCTLGYVSANAPRRMRGHTVPEGWLRPFGPGIGVAAPQGPAERIGAGLPSGPFEHTRGEAGQRNAR